VRASKAGGYFNGFEGKNFGQSMTYEAAKRLTTLVAN